MFDWLFILTPITLAPYVFDPGPLDVCTMPMYMLLQPPTTVDVCTWNIILCWRRQTGCAPKCRRSRLKPSKSPTISQSTKCVFWSLRM